MLSLDLSRILNSTMDDHNSLNETFASIDYGSFLPNPDHNQWTANATTLAEIMSKCTIQLWNSSSEYSKLSPDQQVHLNCDWCHLSKAELDILYSDHTCVKSSYKLVHVICFVYAIVFILGVCGNVMVLWAVVRGGRALSSVMHLFIANLAMGDLLMVMLCVPFTVTAVIVLHYWPFGYILCVAVSYLQAVSVFVSAYSLVAISLDRYMAILYPLKPRLSRLQARLIIVTVWVLAFFTCLPVAIFSTLEVPTEGYHKHHSLSVCHEVWPGEQQSLRQSYAFTLLMLHYFLPISVMVFTYTRILWRVWGSRESAAARAIKASTQLSRTPSGGRDAFPSTGPNNVVGSGHLTDPSPAKMIRMTVTVVLVYSLCWLPFNVLMVVQEHVTELVYKEGFHIMWASCHWLAMAHTVFNPLILYWLNITFRRAANRLLYRQFPTACHSCISRAKKQEGVPRLQRVATCTTSCTQQARVLQPSPFDGHTEAEDIGSRLAVLSELEKSPEKGSTKNLSKNGGHIKMRKLEDSMLPDFIQAENYSKSGIRPPSPGSDSKNSPSKGSKLVDQDSVMERRKESHPDWDDMEIVLPDSRQNSALVKYRRVPARF